MTATDLATTSTQRQPAKIGRQVARAIEAMVWEGHRRDKAAKIAGMAPKSLYNAFRRAPVKQAYLAECEVLRVSGRARRIHRLEEMVEQNDNKAAVINAALALDRIESEQHQRHSSAFSSSPGLVIVVNGNAAIQSTTDTVRTLQDSSSQAIDNDE